MDTANVISGKTLQKVIIYYFTGTGNSGKVAEWLSQVAAKNNIEYQIINIAKIDRHAIQPPEPEALVVFISPVHGFNYPPIMLNFIRHFPKGKNKVVLMNTRAGMRIGKLITPGISGIAFYWSALVLFLKGFSVKAIFPVDMPSNWISLHPGLNARTVKYLHVRNKEKVLNFAELIFQGKTYYRALFEIYDLFLTPIALGYYLVGRFFLAKTFYASHDCNNCDLCIKSCPAKAIIKVDSRPFWTFKCESCMKCMSDCPKKAIETGHGYIAVFIFFFYTFVVALFCKYFNRYIFPVENELLKMVLESILIIVFIGLWYRLLHWLLRFKIPERWTVYTSLTKYKWWGRRYKALKDELNSENVVEK